jgi:hypothetical protein
MASASGRGASAPSADITTFFSLIASLPKPSKHTPSRFVEKLDKIPVVPDSGNGDDGDAPLLKIPESGLDSSVAPGDGDLFDYSDDESGQESASGTPQKRWASSQTGKEEELLRTWKKSWKSKGYWTTWSRKNREP